MKKQAILVVSFGTTIEETRQKNIIETEEKIKQEFAEYTLYTAFTSNIIRKILAKRGVEIDDVSAAMDRMHSDGITKVILQPTHLLFGDEFDKMCLQALQKEHLFESVLISTPLLAGTEDMQNVLQILNKNVKTEDDECLVLMGHGTEHFCNPVYAALDYMAKSEDMQHIFVGTVEAYPDLTTTLNAVKKAGYKKAVITPLMFVAGDHAINDMASQEKDSWKSVFEANEIQTRCVLKGLGEYKEIKDIYCNHIKQTLGEN